jgi:hypothetical protein
MDQLYYQHYLELAQYLIEIFSHSNIVSFEFSITLADPEQEWHIQDNPYICDFFASIIQNEKVYEWNPSSKALLQLYFFQADTLTYQIQNYSHGDFLDDIFERLPFLRDNEFLVWLRQWMPQYDSGHTAYLSMDRTNPDKHMNVFLQPLRKILFFNQLSHRLGIENEKNILFSEEVLKKI